MKEWPRAQSAPPRIQRCTETILENLVCTHTIRASQLASLSGTLWGTAEAQTAVLEQTSAE